VSRLHDLYAQEGQSPWLDNLRRGWITGGELERWVERGIRGITSNPSIFQKAIAGASDYDEQFGDLIGSGTSVDEA
jgi:transaldolase